MARARNIKPGFFTNEELVELPFSTRLLFIGLWTLADREGRLEDRPKKIRAQVFPYDDGLNIDEMMDSLAESRFLVRYSVDGVRFAQIINFTKHQNPHHKEVPSEIPPPPGMDAVTRHAYAVSKELRDEVFARDGCKCLKCGATEGLSIDHILALAKGGDNSKDNLQTLCTKCNSSKGDLTKDYRSSVLASSMNQRKANVEASCPSDSLIPDSLIPDPGYRIPSAADGTTDQAGQATGDEQPARAEIAPATLLSIEFNAAGIRTQPADPRLLTLAEQGVTPQTVAAACAEAKAAKPTESIGLGYVLAILTRWAADAAKVKAGGAAQPRASPGYQTSNDKAKAWADSLTGRNRNHEPDHRTIIDLNDAPARKLG